MVNIKAFHKYYSLYEIKKFISFFKANAKANQPPMRLNTNRLVNDEEDDEYIRRPMISLTTSTTPSASSNISIITVSEIPSTQNSDKKDKNNKQSLPNAHDFPALSSTNTTQNNCKLSYVQNERFYLIFS